MINYNKKKSIFRKRNSFNTKTNSKINNKNIIIPKTKPLKMKNSNIVQNLFRTKTKEINYKIDYHISRF